MSRRWLGLLVVFFPHLAVAHLEAQMVRGRVVDAATGGGVQQATVAILSEGRTVAGSLTDSDGRFSIPIGEPGTYLLRATGQGYLPLEQPELRVFPGDDLSLADIRLRPNPVALEGITVEARQRGRTSGQERVRQRQLLGDGTFVPGAVLVVERPTSLTAYLADIADLHVRYDFHGTPYLWSPVGPYHCLVAQVNHWPLTALGYRSLDDISLRRIAAIEIYNTAAEVPPESQLLADVENPQHCACGKCGLVNVWYWSSW